jgi:hypothetical protein
MFLYYRKGDYMPEDTVYKPYTLDTNKASMYVMFEEFTPIWEFKCTWGNLSSSKRMITMLIDQLNRAYYAGIKFATQTNLLMTYPDVLMITPFTVGVIDKLWFKTTVINYNRELFMKCSEERYIKKYAEFFNAAYREGIHSVYMDKLTQE